MGTALQMVFTYYISGDDRLARKAIYDFHCSCLPSGMLRSRYPTVERQVIPGFALYWIWMLQINEAVKKQCWSQEKRIFRDGPQVEQYSQHVQLWSVLSGLSTGEEAARLMKATLQDKGIAPVSYSMAYYLFRALSEAGVYDLSFPLWDQWRHMVKLNMTTWAEDPVGNRSDCHAWGSTPLYEFPAEILGVKPDLPGYRRISVQPKPGHLTYAEGSAMTPHGAVHVRWSIREDGSFHIIVNGPKQVPVRLILPDGTEREYKSASRLEDSCLFVKQYQSP